MIKTDLTEIKVDVKNAALLGLMVNELVTNAIKHALPRTPKGEIRINIEKSGDAITLRVSDNGPGMPDGFEPELSDSLGLKLVSMVAAQIGGTVTTDGPAGRGTSVTVVFPYRREI